MEGRKERNVLFNDALNAFFIYGYMEKEGNVLFNDALNAFFIYGYMEGRKEMFYLTTHSTHFLFTVIWKEGRKEMFYLTTHSTHFIYGVRHMVKDHSDSEKGNPLPPHRLLLLINSKGSFICTDRITHTTAFVTPVVEHWLERTIVMEKNVNVLSSGAMFSIDYLTRKEGRKEIFYLTTHSTHFIFMVIWRQTYGKEPLR